MPHGAKTTQPQAIFSDLTMPLPKFLSQLTRVFLATPCLLCQRSTAALLCDSCYRQMCACRWSSSSSDDLTHGVVSHQRVFKQTETSLSVFAWGRYQGVLKQLLALLKYRDQAELGVWLGCQLGQQWQASCPQSSLRPLVVPIPLHSERLRQRGYNQAALIAKGFCRVTGLPLAEHGLIRVKATNTMHCLGLNERQANLVGAFRLGKELSPGQRPILLIDDIYTTGTTAKIAADLLTQAGYSVLGIAIVAQAVLLSPSVGVSRPSLLHQTLNSRPNP